MSKRHKVRLRLRTSVQRLARYYLFVLCLFFVLISNPVSVLATCSASETMDDNEKQEPLTPFKKEAIDSIREITLQLILIAVGVFAVVGGLVAGKDDEKEYRHRIAISISFILFGISILLGLFAYGTLIFDLSSGTFCPAGYLRLWALGQWGFFFLAAPFLVWFLIINIHKRRTK